MRNIIFTFFILSFTSSCANYISGSSITLTEYVGDKKSFYRKFSEGRVKRIHGCKIVYNDMHDRSYLFGPKPKLYGYVSAFSFRIIPFYNKITLSSRVKVLDMNSNKAIDEIKLSGNLHEVNSLVFDILSIPYVIFAERSKKDFNYNNNLNLTKDRIYTKSYSLIKKHLASKGLCGI